MKKIPHAEICFLAASLLSLNFSFPSFGMEEDEEESPVFVESEQEEEEIGPLLIDGPPPLIKDINPGNNKKRKFLEVKDDGESKQRLENVATEISADKIDEPEKKKARRELDVKLLEKNRDDEIRNLLVHAISQSSVSKVRNLLRATPGLANILNPKITSKNDKTIIPLHQAAKQGDLEIVILLHQAGANLYAIDADGNQAIHYAAKADHEEIVSYLYETGIPVNVRNSERNTPMHFAAKGNAVKVIIFLLKIDPMLGELPNAQGSLPFHYACLYGAIDVVKILLGRNKTLLWVKNHNGNYPFDHAASSEILEYLIDNAPVHFRKIALDLVVNAKTNLKDITYLKLLEKKIRELHVPLIPGDPRLKTLVDLALECRDEELVKLVWDIQPSLLDNLSDNDVSSILDCVIVMKSETLVQYILSRYPQHIDRPLKSTTNISIGAFNYSEQLTPLCLAAFKGSLPIVKMIMLIYHQHSHLRGVVQTNNHPLRHVASSGRNVLHFAAISGDVELIRYLLKTVGSLAKQRDQTGFTPMFWAARLQDLGMIKEFFAYDKELWKTRDSTIFHVAATFNNVEIFKMFDALLTRKADLYSLYYGISFKRFDNANLAPIHIAALHGNIDVLKWYFNKNLKPWILTNGAVVIGDDIFHIAANVGQIDVLNYLTEEQSFSLKRGTHWKRRYHLVSNPKTLVWMISHGYPMSFFSDTQKIASNLVLIDFILTNDRANIARTMRASRETQVAAHEAFRNLALLIASRNHDDLVLEFLETVNMDSEANLLVNAFLTASSCGSTAVLSKMNRLFARHSDQTLFENTINRGLFWAAHNHNADAVLLLLDRAIAEQGFLTIDIMKPWRHLSSLMRSYRSYSEEQKILFMTEESFAKVEAMESAFVQAAYLQQYLLSGGKIEDLKFSSEFPIKNLRKARMKHGIELPEEIQQQILHHFLRKRAEK